MFIRVSRYGREDEEVMGLKFCNEAVMCLAQLYPPHAGNPEGTTPLQVSDRVSFVHATPPHLLLEVPLCWLHFLFLFQLLCLLHP